MTSQDLDLAEYNSYYAPYIGLVPSTETLIEGLRSGREEAVNFFTSIEETKLNYRYAEGKWTPKEILIHLIDTERIFAYRALRFARKDKTPVQGFEQDDYIRPSKAYSRTMDSLLQEYKSVRGASLALFESMDEEMLKGTGMASGSELSARAAGFIIAGHDRHHIAVIKERYV
jgi:hypothetical protein